MVGHGARLGENTEATYLSLPVNMCQFSGKTEVSALG